MVVGGWGGGGGGEYGVPALMWYWYTGKVNKDMDALRHMCIDKDNNS